MIKFILHGGHARAENDENESFFREFSSSFKDNTKVLLNFFAGKEDGNPEQIERYKRKINNTCKSIKLKFIVANQDSFLKQLKESHAMYVGGGSTPLLVNKLSKYKNLDKLFEGKIIAGSSAGAYFLTKYYYENDDNNFYKGLGILNIKALCHYNKENREIVEKLNKYKERLPIIILPDYIYTVVYK